MTWAAIFIIIFIGASNISKLVGNFSSYKTTSSSMEKTDTANSSDNSLIIKGNDEVKNNLQDSNSITFQKLEIERNHKIIPKDTWKLSSNGKYSACVDGENKNIYVKENITGKLWSYTISNKLDQQNTPLFVDWSQKDKMLMVIVGKATGTITEGGDMYVLNIDSAIAELIYRPSELEKVKSLREANGAISAELIVYEDSKFLRYHIENIRISLESINNMMLNMSKISKEASIIFEYQENINNNRLEAALKLISKKHIEGKAFNYNNLLYDIDNMSVTSLKKTSSSYSIDQITKDSFQHEAFLAEVNYKLKKEGNTIIKGGKNSIVVVLVKDSKDSSWKIGEINVLN